MKRIEKIAIIFIILGLCWTAIKTTYGIGYRNGMLKVSQEISEVL